MASPESRSTCERILAAATEVFLELGYRKATFREICRRAPANTAAINYHFRDKEGLYLAVLERALDESRQAGACQSPPESASPEEKLRAYIAIIMRSILSPGESSVLFTLMSHEMAEPTRGLDLVVEKAIRPFDRELEQVVRTLTGPQVTDQQVHDCVQCIVGQCNHFRQAKAVISRLGYYPVHDAQSLEHLIDHITRFSLAGLRGIAPR